jgi:hypothetical protein
MTSLSIRDVQRLIFHIVSAGTIHQILPDEREKIAAMTVYFLNHFERCGHVTVAMAASFTITVHEIEVH